MDKFQSNRLRKEEQLRVHLDEDTSFRGLTTGLENYTFVHQALPEIDKSSIDPSTQLFGKKLSAPLIISSMIGGIETARRINRNLARAAQSAGIAMALGSQRAAVDNPAVAHTYQVRDIAPDVLLFANLGAVQLNNGYGAEQCRKAVDILQADALILHLNPLHEALQPDGNTNFSGLLKKIEGICRKLSVPVVVKEVGFGISGEVAKKLAEAGVAGIDVAGAGGTSWVESEKLLKRNKTHSRIAGTFAGWGIPTVESLVMAHNSAPGVPIIASGGIRTGIDVAKVICLGAAAAGIAMPFLKAAAVSAKAVTTEVNEIIEELRITMFCLGVSNIPKLSQSALLRRAP